MTPSATKATLQDIQALRALFLQEANFQIRYNACHERGWTDSYLLKVGDADVGYGSIKGQERAGRFEFYVIPSFRKSSGVLFHELVAASGAKRIECQSNDLLLSSMLYEFSRDVRAGRGGHRGDVRVHAPLQRAICRSLHGGPEGSAGAGIWKLHPPGGEEGLLSGGQGPGRPLPAPQRCVTGDAAQGRLDGVWIHVDGQCRTGSAMTNLPTGR
jgi:hypothetical protein